LEKYALCKDSNEVVAVQNAWLAKSQKEYEDQRKPQQENEKGILHRNPNKANKPSLLDSSNEGDENASAEDEEKSDI